ncbi:hypothetical protein LZK73_26495 (plasmid) [Neorhizobium galegae]|nr:hypothetical protein LZK73_26495 [Neorhizobium galegae]
MKYPPASSANSRAPSSVGRNLRGTICKTRDAFNQHFPQGQRFGEYLLTVDAKQKISRNARIVGCFTPEADGVSVYVQRDLGIEVSKAERGIG